MEISESNYFICSSLVISKCYKEIFKGFKSKKEGEDQESIQPSTTPDPRYQWESDNITIRHHKQEPRGQPFPSRWPQGINKQSAWKHNKTRQK